MLRLPPVPDRLRKRITELGGLTPDGTKPLFRVVRGSDEFIWIGGRIKKFDEHGNQTGEEIGTEKRPKYPNALNRYVLEMWRPPEYFGTPESWEEMFTEWIDGHRVETMGPFPANGDYDCLLVIERVHMDKKGNVTKREFAPLTDTLCEALVQVAKLNRELPEQIKRTAISERHEREEKAKEERLIERIEDLGRAEFATKPNIIVPDMKEVLEYGH